MAKPHDPSFQFSEFKKVGDLKPKSKRRATNRKAGGPRMSLDQLGAASRNELLRTPHYSPSKKWTAGTAGGQPLNRARQGMANKLLKGGGSIRLPQMPKGSMKAMLPMLLLTLLMGGMGEGNEDLDGMLG